MVGLSALVVVGGLAARRTGVEAGSSAEAAAPGPMAELPAGASAEPATETPDATDGCHFDDRGYGRYEKAHALSTGRLLAHPHIADGDGSYELLLHFHGAEPVRRLLAPEGLDLVIAAMDAGTVSSDYDRALPDEESIRRWMDEIDVKVAEIIGRDAHPRRVTFSSWSAGYAAMDAALDRASRWREDDAPRLGGVVLLDSLHASFGADGEQIVRAPLTPFLDAARDAAEGGPLFFLSHSAIQTDGYASTTQVADFFLHALDVHAESVRHGGDDTLQLRRRYERARLSIAGYEGGDREAHCAHLRLLPGVLTEHILDRAAR